MRPLQTTGLNQLGLFNLGSTNVIDNFEEQLYEDQNQSLSDLYSGDIVSFSRQQSTVIGGSYALKTDQSASIDILSSSGLPKYPSQGTTVRYYTRASSTGPRTYFFAFASGQGSNGGLADNGYGVRVNWGTNWRLLERNNGGTANSSDSSTNPPSADTWYYIDLLYDANGDLSVDVYRNSDDSLQASISFTPSNDFSGTDGILFGDADGGATIYWDSVITV